MAAWSSSKRSIGTAAKRRVVPAVGPLEPLLELGVEVGGPGEATSGEEARLEIAVVSLDYALGLGVARVEHDHLHPEGASEPLEGIGQLRLAAVTRHEGTLVVIDTLPRHGVDHLQAGEVARENVVGLPRGDHPPHHHPGVAEHADDHRGTSHLACLERDVRRWEPQVPLSDLPGPILGATGRIGRHVERSELSHPSFSTVRDLVQPMRSAITVAGIRGVAIRSRLISGSTASTMDPLFSLR